MQEITILNRVLRWTRDGLEYEADPRHSEILISELGLSSSSPVVTPGVKDAQGCTDTPLSPSEATRFCALVARANYLAMDRCDIQFAVKELSRRMSAPTDSDWCALKRLGRYLVGKPRAVCHFKWQSNVSAVHVYSD